MQLNVERRQEDSSDGGSDGDENDCKSESASDCGSKKGQYN